MGGSLNQAADDREAAIFRERRRIRAITLVIEQSRRPRLSLKAYWCGEKNATTLQFLFIRRRLVAAGCLPGRLS